MMDNAYNCGTYISIAFPGDMSGYIPWDKPMFLINSNF